MSPSSDFLELSQAIGSQVPFWTQGAGGNVSHKQGPSMWIKASGFRLDQITADTGLAVVDFHRLADLLAKSQPLTEADYALSLQVCANMTAPFKKPSMESGFHALLPLSFVCHFHALSAVLMAELYFHHDLKFKTWLQGRSEARQIAFIPDVAPGLRLAKALEPHLDKSFFLLAHHGVVMQSDSKHILQEWQMLESAFWHEFVGSAPTLSLAETPSPFRVYFPDMAVFLAEVRDILEECGNGLFIKKKEAGNRDAQELWQATSMLYHLRPELSELPTSLIREISQLETEKIRLLQKSGHA